MQTFIVSMWNLYFRLWARRKSTGIIEIGNAALFFYNYLVRKEESVSVAAWRLLFITALFRPLRHFPKAKTNKTPLSSPMFQTFINFCVDSLFFSLPPYTPLATRRQPDMKIYDSRCCRISNARITVSLKREFAEIAYFINFLTPRNYVRIIFGNLRYSRLGKTARKIRLAKTLLEVVSKRVKDLIWNLSRKYLISLVFIIIEDKKNFFCLFFAFWNKKFSTTMTIF